ncbi:MAG: RNA polymerase sigma-70 factor [Bacteroidales bacterium]|nr:RNA polymerase sigma-70 factor [Bacteroidales bacterium]
MKEKEQLKKIKEGDRQAFDDFCRDKLPMLLSYAGIFLKNEWAEDVVQDVLFGFWQNRESIDVSQAPRNYLLRSVYNRSLNYLKKEGLAMEYRKWNDARISLLGMEGADPDRNPVIRKMYDADLRELISSAMDSLPPKCREVFEMSYIALESNKDIARRLDISVKTVESHIYNALKILRKALSAEKALVFFTILPFLNNF